MANLKLLVVEDEIIIADDICDALEDLGYAVLEPAVTYTEAIERLGAEQPDFALLDINLAGSRDGIDVAWYIRDHANIPFIFLTSNADPATVERAKKVQPYAYLLKPFSKEELYTSIEIALYNYSLQQTATPQQAAPEPAEQLFAQDHLFVKHKQRYVKIKLDDLAYLQSEHVYVNLVLLDGSEYLVRSSLGKLAESLPDHFFKIHRSYVLNMNHIQSIGMTKVSVAGTELPFGKGYRAALMERIEVL